MRSKVHSMHNRVHSRVHNRVVAVVQHNSSNSTYSNMCSNTRNSILLSLQQNNLCHPRIRWYNRENPDRNWHHTMSDKKSHRAFPRLDICSMYSNRVLQSRLSNMV